MKKFITFFCLFGICFISCFSTAYASPKHEVLNGIDVLKKENFSLLKGKKVALVTNQTGRDKDGNLTIDLLFKAPDVELVALFGPEHGIRGVLDQSVINDDKDEETGLPVYSLYGKTRKPSLEQLKGIDVLVFDIQDVGCRFYTYISTMFHCMQAASVAGIEFMVLDRINPINGKDVEGPVLKGKTTFVGIHTIAIRHGMTMGELAQMMNAECGINAKLSVVHIEGWKRSYWQNDTDISWKNPSPNMRGLWAAALYPGIGVLEFTPVSVGRGTTIPFEIFGAPYIDAERLTQELESYHFNGIDFEPCHFTPSTSVFANQECHGVRFKVTDRENVKVIDLGMVLAETLLKWYPENYSLKRLNTLLFHEDTCEAIFQGADLKQIHAIWKKDLKEFKNRRARYLIYK